MQQKTWRVAKRTDKDILKQLFINRNLKTKREQEEFLHPPQPTLASILSQSQISRRSLEKAMKRIIRAINSKEKIVIYGDYDADGITGTTILWETIYHLGGRSLPYIPSRKLEGYGLNKEAVRKLASEKVGLIITVDCGITAIEEVEAANSLHLDVIVTDHHQQKKKMPSAYAVIYDETLVGVSLAWLLAMAVKKGYEENNQERKKQVVPEKDLDLIAVGTIADLQPLLGKNRALVKWGLAELNRTKRLGLRCLIKKAGLHWGEIDSHQVGFMIAPRLNATGRLEDGLQAVRLLCTKDRAQALGLANELTKLNQQRQEMTLSSFVEAEAQIESSSERQIFILFHQSWHEGIIGLIASRIKEKYHRPVLAISSQGKVGKGSARSIVGFNIIEALRQVEDLLLDCGGHPMAAGFTIEVQKISTFRARMETLAKETLNEKLLNPVLEIEAIVKGSEIIWKLKKQIDSLKPFGVGNPEPTLLLQEVIVNEFSLVGKQKNHLKLKIHEQNNPGRIFEVIGFNLGGRYLEIKKGDQVDIVFTLAEDSWNGERRLFLKLKDFQIPASHNYKRV